MIAKLKGKIDEINEDHVIIDVLGVCYTVYVSLKFIESLKVGDSAEIRTMHIFKQEQQFLCGFANFEEQTVFKALLDVHGVGVKSGMSVLSSLSPMEIAVAIATQDSSILCKVNGIGKKTAERILLELKDKTITKFEYKPSEKSSTNSINDAILGLISLGYQKSQVIKVVNNVINREGNNITTNDLIVLCLKEIK